MARNSSEFDLGARLAAIRARHGVSQGTAARRAELAPAYLSRIENGHVQPTFATVRRVLEALHANLDELRSPDDEAHDHRPGCPVTDSGCCLVRLTRGNAEVARAEGKEVYAQREVRLLNRLARFMRDATPERVRAIEMLVEELLEKA
jgi:transcriptional regulator with XRE-family HTH domain